MRIIMADKSYVSDILELQKLYHIDSISEQDKKDGFLTAKLTRNILYDIIDEENSLIIVIEKRMVIGYAVVCSWDLCSEWPNVPYLIKNLHSSKIDGVKLNTQNTCQYGPVCIHKDYRGLNILENLFIFCKKVASKRYSYIVTFINKDNARSFSATTRKTSLRVLGEFTNNGKYYYKLACSVR